MYRAQPRQRTIKKSSKYTHPIIPQVKHVLWLVVFALIVYYFFFSNSGFLTLIRLKKVENNLHEQIRVLQMQQTELQTNVDKLNNDPDYVEKIARERFQLAKKGETIYLMLPQNSQPQDSSK